MERSWKKAVIEFLIVFAVFFAFTMLMLDPILDAIEANQKRYDWTRRK